MRLIITAIVCSLLTVGGFFGFKQYQRSQMKQDARAYVMTMIQRHSDDFGPEAEAQLAESVRRNLNEVFRRHYESGGLSKPAEFDEVGFSRELFERIYNETRDGDVTEETKDYAARMFVHSRPIQQGALGGVGGGRLPDDTPEDELPDDELPEDDNSDG